MQEIQSKHAAAMEFARRAAMKKTAGAISRFKSLSRKAFKLEREAAEMVAPLRDLEPTRSILHRSAAALALDCEEYRAAEQLAAAGLGGNPPDEIADELRDIREQARANFSPEKLIGTLPRSGAANERP